MANLSALALVRADVAELRVAKLEADPLHLRELQAQEVDRRRVQIAKRITELEPMLGAPQRPQRSDCAAAAFLPHHGKRMLETCHGRNQESTRDRCETRRARSRRHREALAFYGRLFEFTLRGKSEDAAFIDLGDQFLALQKGRKQPGDDGRHFGLVVDDKEARRKALTAAGVKLLPGRFLDLLDPSGNRIEIVGYENIQFSKAPQGNGSAPSLKSHVME